MPLFNKIIEYAYTTEGGYNDFGVYEKGTEMQGNFKGSIQTLNNRDISVLQTGIEGVGKLKMYAPVSVDLPIPIKDGQTAYTTVMFDEQKYKVVSKGKYSNGVIPHNKYMLELVQPNEEVKAEAEMEEPLEV